MRDPPQQNKLPRLTQKRPTTTEQATSTPLTRRGTQNPKTPKTLKPVRPHKNLNTGGACHTRIGYKTGPAARVVIVIVTARAGAGCSGACVHGGVARGGTTRQATPMWASAERYSHHGTSATAIAAPTCGALQPPRHLQKKQQEQPGRPYSLPQPATATTQDKEGRIQAGSGQDPGRQLCTAACTALSPPTHPPTRPPCIYHATKTGQDPGSIQVLSPTMHLPRHHDQKHEEQSCVPTRCPQQKPNAGALNALNPTGHSTPYTQLKALDNQNCYPAGH